MKKYVYGFLIYCIVALVAIPMALLNYGKEEEIAKVITINNQDGNSWENQNDLAIDFVSSNSVFEEMDNYVTGEKTPLEEYIIGVVAAEMPALFNIEALRAQAVAARTYAVNQMESKSTDIEGMIASGSQAYNTIIDMKDKWGKNYDVYYKKIETAVLSTSGEIMIYDDEPILAVFHAISAGKTETAENIWNSSLPYLKSVDSKMDEDAAEFSYEISIPVTTVASLLQKADKSLQLYDGNLKEQMQVIDRTEAGYIKTMQIGNVIFTGRQVREALGLRSADFVAKQEGDQMIFTTTGYGHGAGMSQYGANFMAEDGKNYKEILNHYYSEIQFEKMN